MSQNNNKPGKKTGLDKAARAVKNVANITGDMKTIARNAGAIYNSAKTAVRVVKALVGANDRSWYVKYVNVKPAKNTDRNMDPTQNLDITDNPNLGGMPKYAEVIMSWHGLHDSNVWSNMIGSSYQLIRNYLKSNLPYSQTKLEAYVNNAITLAILCAQTERDIMWNQFSDPKLPEFASMYRLRATSYGTVGPVSLHEDVLLASDWSDTIASYDELVDQIRSTVRLAPSLSLFIKHYFGSVFVTSPTAYNTQYYYNRLINLDWAVYDQQTDTISWQTLNATELTIEDLIELIISTSKQFGIVIADTIKSSQYVPFSISKFGEQDYSMVYDETYLQALANGYTDRSAVTPEGYIRLDEYPNTPDDLTTYLFLGGAQPESKYGRAPAITIEAMVIKFDSVAQLKWSQLISKYTYGDESNGSMSFDGPFGYALKTEIIGHVDTSTIINETTTNITKTLYNWPTYTNISDTAESKYSLRIVPRIYAQDVVSHSIGNFIESSASDPWALIFPLFIVNGTDASSNNFRTCVFLCYKFTAFPRTYSVELLPLDINKFDFQTLRNNFRDHGLYGLSYNTLVNTYGTSVSMTYDANQLAELFKLTISESLLNFVATLAVSNDVRRTMEIRMDFTNAAYAVQIADANDLNSEMLEKEYSLLVNATKINSYMAKQISYVSKEASSITTHSTDLTLLEAANFGKDALHTCIPIVSSIHYDDVYSVGSKATHTEWTSTPILIKEEVIPFYYNTKDLRPTLYNMFMSLLVPSDDIFSRLVDPKTRSRFNGKSNNNNKTQNKTKTEEEPTKQA